MDSELIYSSVNFRQVVSLLVISLCGPISETACAALVGVIYLNVMKNYWLISLVGIVKIDFTSL